MASIERNKYSREVIEAARVLLDYLKKSPDCKIGIIAGVNLPADLVESARSAVNVSPSDLMRLWNACRNKRLSPCRLLTDKRRRHCSARLKTFPDLKLWEKFLNMINKNDWCLGLKPSKDYPDYRVNFDWFIRPENIVKFLEGGFRDQAEPKEESRRDTYGSDLDKRNAERENT